MLAAASGGASLHAPQPVPRVTFRLAVIAASVSAAKVALFAAGGSAFLAAHGAAGLGWFYLALAMVAATAASLVAPRLERDCPGTALLALLAGTALGVLAVAGLLAGGWPWAGALLLLLAHVYNIASEILLWVLAATWLPAPDLRRATVWVCLAAAVGGFLGGVAAERLVAAGPAVACVLVTALAAAHGGFWLRRGLALPNRGSARPVEETFLEAATPLPARIGLLAHPLGPLLGACSFMLTLVWCMTEFLCFAVYERRFAEPATLAGFLAALYAFQQVVEFACIALVTGPVTRRMSPVGRSLLFPLGSLVSVLAMGREYGLPATVIAHTHTEAISNGLFDPVHAANFAAVPHRHQTRIRAASEGVCYPLGMAAGGAVLLLWPGGSELDLLLTATAAAAVLFLAVGVFTGTMVTPAMLQELGLVAELGPPPRRAELRAAKRALAPWARRTRLRERLLAARGGRARPAWLERRIAAGNRRALREVFARAGECAPGGLLPQLEVLLDSHRLERRALAAETLLSLPVRPLFLAFAPALRTCYLA